MALYRTGQLYLQEYSDRTRAEEYFREVASEKGNSEVNTLAKQTLADLKQLALTQRKIHRADSLAAARASRQSSPNPEAEPPAASPQDSTVLVAADTTSQLTKLSKEESARRLREALEADEQALEEIEEPVEEDGEEEEDGVTPRPRRTATTTVDTSIERAIFAVAELYRERLVAADSAAYYYEEVIRRFPSSREVPRAMYNLAWIRVEMQNDMELARPVLEDLVERYPQTIHANAARGLLDLPATVTDEDLAVEEFRRIEAIRTQDVDRIDLYLPLLDSLEVRYPDADTAVKSAFLAAWSVENIAGDSTEATRRFDDIVLKYPASRYAALGRERRTSRKQGSIEKLARQLAVMARGADTEGLEVIAVEPTREDSNALSHKYLGFALRAHRRGSPDKAKEWYELSVEEKYRTPRAHYGLGVIAWENAYFEDAIDYLRTALHQDPAFPATYHHLFDYHLQQSREDSANHYLRQIIKRDRDNMAAQALVDEFPALQTRDERLDRLDMEEIDLELPLNRFETPAKLLSLKEEPFVRYKVDAEPQPGLLDSAVVVVDVLVSRAGLPDEVEVFEGPDNLHEEAMAVAKQFLFYPAEDNRGRNPKVWIELEIPFRPADMAEGAASADTAAVLASPDADVVDDYPGANAVDDSSRVGEVHPTHVASGDSL